MVLVVKMDELGSISGVFDGDTNDVARQQYVFRLPATCHRNTQPGTLALEGLLVGCMGPLIAGGTCEPSPIESGSLAGWNGNVAWLEYSCFSIGVLNATIIETPMDPLGGPRLYR